MSEMRAETAGLKISLGDEIVGRIDAAGAISERRALTRVFLTKEHRAAADLILSWMRAAGCARISMRSEMSAAAMKGSGRVCRA